MKPENFLIVAQSRSGTQWLAEALNASPTWRVLHEPQWNGPKKRKHSADAGVRLNAARRRFKQERYGEVQSYWCEWCAYVLPIDRIGVVVRDPADNLLSQANHVWKQTKGNQKAFESRLRSVTDETLRRAVFLDALIELGCCAWRFNEVVGRRVGLANIARWADIDDLPVETVSMEKVNTRQSRFTSLDECPPFVRQAAESMEWFRIRHMA